MDQTKRQVIIIGNCIEAEQRNLSHKQGTENLHKRNIQTLYNTDTEICIYKYMVK